jgi:hypothetical protein
MAENNSQSTQTILGAALLLIAAFVIGALVLVNSQADDINTNATVNNTAPTVVSTYINSASGTLANSFGQDGSGITLTAGSTKVVYVNGEVSDANGREDISKVDVVVYNPNTDNDCSADKNNCYIMSSAGGSPACTLSDGGTSLKKNFTCTWTIQYWADATDSVAATAGAWKAYVVVTDAASSTGNNSGAEASTDIQSLVALNFPSSITFPALALGAGTAAGDGATGNVNYTITQYGNDVADTVISMANALPCTIGSIPLANLGWSNTDVAYDADTSLSTTATDTNSATGLRTDDSTALTDIIYMNILIPSTGVGGSCASTSTSNGAITMTATAS